MATKPVDQWSLTDAKTEAARGLPTDYEDNRKLIEDKDAWQDGKLWPGHRTGDPVTDAALRANIKPQFISDDVLGEAVDNRSAGLVGQEADVTLVPVTEDPAEEPVIDDATQQEIDSIVAALSTWWDRAGLWPNAAKVIDRISYAERAGLRCYVPSGKLVGNTLPTAKSLPEALANIEVDAPTPSMAARYVDPLTNAVSAIIITKVDEKEQAEVWTVDPVTGTTGVRVLTDTASALGPFDTRGRLPLAVAKGKRIVTPSVRSLQAQLNFIATVTTRTVETAGHRERYIGNVDPPGMWLPYPPTTGPALEMDETDPTQTYWKHRVPWVVGANITTELQGLPETVRDPDGTERVTYAEPSVTTLDPVNPQYTTDAAAVITRRIYRRCKQGHLGLDQTAESSGIAYQQARAQFESDLRSLKPPVEMMLRDLLEAVLAFAGLMHAASRTILDRFRVQVTLHPTAGPVSADEQRLAIELRNARVISQDTALARVGAEDPVVEQDSIDADAGQAATLWATLTTALTALMGLENMTLAGAGYLLNLTEEQLTVLATGLPPAGAGITLPEAATRPTPRTDGGNVDESQNGRPSLTVTR